jgi:hypothetical protein
MPATIDAPTPLAEAMRYPATRNSFLQPSGCLRHQSKHSAGHRNANVSLSKPVAAKCSIQHFKERSAKLSNSVAYSPKKGLLGANLTIFLTTRCQLLLKNRQYFREEASECDYPI